MTPVGRLVPVVDEPDETPAVESWDAMWAEVRGDRTETIRGVVVRVPTGFTLDLEQRLEELKTASGLGGFIAIATELFGAAACAELREARLDLLQWQVLVAWGMSHARGVPVTFRQAYDEVKARNAEAPQGKASAPTKRSAAGSGGRSRRTSSASTASTPAASSA